MNKKRNNMISLLPTTEKELDEWKREAAIKHVKRLSGQIGLRHQVPKVIFDLAELDDNMKKELINKGEALDWHENCYGAYFPPIHTIYLNYLEFGKRPGSEDKGYIGDLMETIIHELTHARFPMIAPHGDEFNKRERQVLNGKRFPWVILTLPKKNDKGLATGEGKEEEDR